MPRVKLGNVRVAPVARVLGTAPTAVPGRRQARLSVTGMVCGV
ncbi:MAG TPA: hypothetical protein VLH58_12690 [Candidatus Methylomirabilis sp.]|nr:hypothetical protein [Candidatus Methylomirabilis sp.]HSC72208.1 hypothetical protein [Candidatus Methylomirabilis sp.]